MEPFVPNTWTYLFKVYFHHTGCPKKWTMPWHRLKMEIYDFNHYCCSPKKKVYETFGVLWSQIHRYTYSKWIFTIEGVPKNGLISVIYILYTHTHNIKYTLHKGMYVFGQDAYKRLHLIKENIFWDGSYNHWNHIFQFEAHIMALSIF